MVGYHCTGSALGAIDVELDMDVDIHASVSDSVKPGEEFSIEESYTDIDLELDDTVKSTANPLEGKVTKFDLEFENATEKETGDNVVNMAEEELSFGPIGFDDDDETVGFTVPEGDPLRVDLVAGDSGSVEVTAGVIENTVDSQLGIAVDVTCEPREGQETLLNTIPIEDDDGNGEDPEPNPEEEALDAVNEAEDVEAMQEALQNEDLGLDLDGYNALTEDEQSDVAESMLDGTYPDKDSVQSALNESVEAIEEDEEEDPVEEALEEVNAADNPEDMQAALENSDLDLDLAAYNELSAENQETVAAEVLENRPEDGYSDSIALQSVLDEAVEAVEEDEDGQ